MHELAICQSLMDQVESIALERNAQSEDQGDVIRIRVLKNRFAGSLGLADTLIYSKQTGRIELSPSEETSFENTDF